MPTQPLRRWWPPRPQILLRVRPVATAGAVWLEASVRRRPLRLAPSPGHRTVFVVGCPRSGTTWVMSMLQRHPLVIGTLESHAYRLTGPVRRRGPRHPAGWAAVFREVEAAPRLGLLPYANRRTMWRAAVAAASSSPDGGEAADVFIATIFDSYARAQGAGPANVLVEKTPAHLRWARTILEGSPTARMIEVVRDGRDVCVSMQMRAPHVAWAKADRAEQIDVWTSYIQAGELLRSDRTLSGRVLRVRYEDLKADPAAGLARMFDFAGIEADASEVERIVADTDMGAYTGPSDGSTPKRRGVVGDWRVHFTPDDEALFARVAGEAARAAGYEV